MIREKVILRLIKDKDVLDIGSVGQSQKYHLWSKIKKNSRSLIGIDTEFSNEKDIVQGNMENYSFRKKFDVIIAGDVIEHVYNIDDFLKKIHQSE